MINEKPSYYDDPESDYYYLLFTVLDFLTALLLLFTLELFSVMMVVIWELEEEEEGFSSILPNFLASDWLIVGILSPDWVLNSFLVCSEPIGDALS